MLRRYVVGLLLPLFVLAAVGCGGGGGGEAPKVDNPSVKVKPFGDSNKPGEGMKPKVSE
jgi:hypothetical protein